MFCILKFTDEAKLAKFTDDDLIETFTDEVYF